MGKIITTFPRKNMNSLTRNSSHDVHSTSYLRYSTGPAASDLRRQTAGGWAHALRLQHPEGVHSASGPAASWGNGFFLGAVQLIGDGNENDNNLIEEITQLGEEG